ncbi:MAG: mechanosensitive ion channel [Gammaproteobacteria bacterium]|nr:mechanosensitive ion channel [Gammaproteobacteria bacterium]MCW5582433.1 mechanosensitive ion channel [Gammaproteobacteria bacterium]
MNHSTQHDVQQTITWFGLDPLISNIIILLTEFTAVTLISILSFYILRYYEKKIIAKGKSSFITCMERHAFFRWLSCLLPVLVFYFGIELIANYSTVSFLPTIIHSIQIILIAYSIVISAIALAAMLNAIEAYYKYFSIANQFPIKSYIQVIKIIIYIFSGILVVSTLLNKSPIYFLTGIGALTAVLLLIFRDSILGFVASIQLTAYDMIRIGDWIEVPNFGVNGTVLDMSLNTIKVQNFDKTIITIPSYSLLSNSVKNWRGMSDAGGRRIKRSVFIDVNSIQFCTPDLVNHVMEISDLQEKIIEKQKSFFKQNRLKGIENFMPQYSNGMTNLSLFRVYLDAYLKQHPKTHQGMTLLVRQLQDEGAGIPLEIYMFSNDIDWANYEALQSDIMNHIYAMLPLFQLRVFQYLTR